jgi:hypothetical protein
MSDWPMSCPKCRCFDVSVIIGGPPFPVFIRKYCDGVSECTNPTQAGTSTGSEHMHHRCTNCSYVIITPCADALPTCVIVPTIDPKKWWQWWR